MLNTMIQFKTEVKTEIKSLREDLTSLSDSVSNLSICLQDHKKQTETELADFQKNFKTTQSNHTSQLKKIQDDVTCLKIIYGPYICGGTGGWRRVAYLDMTNSNTTCPSGWKLTGYSKRTCGRATDGTNTRDSATFPVRGREYSRICGRI